MKIFFVAAFSILTFSLFAQDDLLKMLDSIAPPVDKSLNRVTATFKDLRIVNMETAQTVGEGELNFGINHRFGNIGAASNGGIHTLYGWDAIADVFLSFDYGITRCLQVGAGRSKLNEGIDGSVKWRFLEQTLDNKVPLTVAVYGIATFTPMSEVQLYHGADTGWVSANKKNEMSHRITYTSQLLLQRKFGERLSVVIAPTYTHRNYVLASINPYNNAVDENDLMSVGAGIRLKITRSMSILADYYYVNSKYRKMNSANPYYAPLAVSLELETGGHVFHFNFTNAVGITENSYLPYSPDSWTKGGYKFGFNISRVFQLSGKSKAKVKLKGVPMSSETSHASTPEPTHTQSAPPPAPAPAPAPQNQVEKTKDMYKANTVLNMRLNPSSSATLIMTISKGSMVEVVEKTNADWWKIKYNDETGFVSSKFLVK
ncbi:MAG TPA: DUF5777 family beta-barrel protein [Bacteroidia bacterium]